MYSSKRTKRRENNLVTDSYKIVHNMFAKHKVYKNKHTDQDQTPLGVTKEVDMRFIRHLIKSISLEQGMGYRVIYRFRWTNT